MQSYHPFFPNYPPPPIPTRDSIIAEGIKTYEQSKTDQQWLKNWIERKKEDKQFSSKSISLSDYRQRLIHHAHLLQQYQEGLKTSNHQNLVQLKIQIEQANRVIYDENLLKNIQKQIHRRKSKRARLRRQQERKFIETNHEIIEQQSPSIDEKPLIEKIEDINSILQTIEQLKQLKNTRQQRQTDQTIVDNDQFSEIQNICTAKLIEYKTELEKKRQPPHVELSNYLFDNHNQSFFESTDPDAQYLLRAHENLHDLVQIRQTWDQYSTTQISSLDNIIPLKWHEPQPPCDSNWTRYIFNKTE